MIQFGGGPIKHAVKDHISKGFNVYATLDATYTFSNDLQEIKKYGNKNSGEMPKIFKVLK